MGNCGSIQPSEGVRLYVGKVEDTLVARDKTHFGHGATQTQLAPWRPHRAACEQPTSPSISRRVSGSPGLSPQSDKIQEQPLRDPGDDESDPKSDIRVFRLGGEPAFHLLGLNH